MDALTRASTEWSRRPPDERYSSLADLHVAACRDKTMAREAGSDVRKMRAVAAGANGVRLIGSAGSSAEFTHWSFGQLAGKAKAPAAYLRTLPAPLVADCLNHGLDAVRDADAEARLLINVDEAGALKLRAFTSDRYARIWNRDITERLLELEAIGPWQPAPAAFDGSRGLYLGDRDMFAFMVDNSRRIFESRGVGEGLSRGFFVWNSEVGATTFGIQTFLYEYVCGNHRVWGVSDVKEIRLRHVGGANAKAFEKLAIDLKLYADASAKDDEAKIETAMACELGKDKDEVLDRIFNLRVGDLSLRMIGQAYDLAEQRVEWYGNPRSVWGITGALTEIARDLPNANDRAALERATAKVTEIAF